MELIRYYPFGKPSKGLKTSSLFLNRRNKLHAFINCSYGTKSFKYPYEYNYNIKENREYFIKSNLTYFL